MQRLLFLAMIFLLPSGCCFKRECQSVCKQDICSIPLTTETMQCGPTQLVREDPSLCFDCGTGITEGSSPYDISEQTISDGEFLQLTLQDCIGQALRTSKIMRDLGGSVIRSPDATVSALQPALVFSDPVRGEEAALSAFDANFFASSIFEENNRRTNNRFFGDNGFFEQYLNTNQVGVTKRSVTGGEYTLRNVTIGDNNNQSSNGLGRQSWESFFEMEMRHALLQGAGTQFNRIAGPNSQPGQINGVLVARTRTDQSLEEFHRAMRDLVADVENAYWDLYYAYRDLEAKIQVRDIAEETLRIVKEKKERGSNIAQAEEQYHRFQSDVIDALNGRTIDGTRVNNGSFGGTFRGTGGVRVAERRLRMLVGLPINDGLLIQPADTPPIAPVAFDWSLSIASALHNREELRQQRWRIKQRELELIANRNFVQPNLDLIARYRYRGLGNRLYGDYAPTSGTGTESFFDGETQEWALGVEYSLPVGFRRAHAAIRNSQLALSQEIEILREQERQVHLGLSNAIGEAKRAFETMSVQEQRLGAIVKQLNLIEEKEGEDERSELDVLLETHRRLLDARLRFHQSQVEYCLALRNVHFEKGTLLHYNNVLVSEAATPGKANMDAHERKTLTDYTIKTAIKDPVITKSR